MVPRNLKQRAVTVYLSSEEQKERWETRSKKLGVSVSKFVIEYVENTLRKEEEPDFRSRGELWKENNDLKQQVHDLAKQCKQLDTVVDKLEQELRKYRSKPYLEDQEFVGVRSFEKDLVTLLQSKEIVTDEEIFSRLRISPKDSKATRAVGKQLENLESVGLVTPSSRGWKWKR